MPMECPHPYGRDAGSLTPCIPAPRRGREVQRGSAPLGKGEARAAKAALMAAGEAGQYDRMAFGPARAVVGVEKPVIALHPRPSF